MYGSLLKLLFEELVTLKGDEVSWILQILHDLVTKVASWVTDFKYHDLCQTQLVQGFPLLRFSTNLIHCSLYSASTSDTFQYIHWTTQPSSTASTLLANQHFSHLHYSSFTHTLRQHTSKIYTLKTLKCILPPLSVRYMNTFLHILSELDAKVHLSSKLTHK